MNLKLLQSIAQGDKPTWHQPDVLANAVLELAERIERIEQQLSDKDD